MKRRFWDVRDDFLKQGILHIPGLRSRILATFASGALLGILAGAVATLLIAPRSGAEMRSRLSGKVKQLKGRALELKADAREQVSRATERASESMRSSDAEPYRNPNVPIG